MEERSGATVLRADFLFLDVERFTTDADDAALGAAAMAASDGVAG
jgi:hypothetical protein